MKNKDLISIADLSRPEIEEIFQVTKELKDLHIKGVEEKCLSGRILGLIFEKSSMRTRVSLEVAIVQLGGYAIYQTQTEINLGKREAIKDVAKVLSRYLNGIAIRTFGHDTVLELAKYATIPVINALTDLYHPCQALTDVYTILEKFKTLENIKIVFIGDGNNVAKSLAQTCIKLGIDFHIASPKGYEFDADFISELKHMANGKNLLHLYRNPEEAAENANVIYTDTWTSMGQEEETAQRLQIFPPYQINQELVSQANGDCIVMHCLPAHRGEEITDAVADGAQSRLWDQAENRLHAQKALLVRLLGQTG